ALMAGRAEDGVGGVGGWNRSGGSGVHGPMDVTMTTPTDGPLTASVVRAALRTSPPTPAPDDPGDRIDDVVVVVDHSLAFSAFYRDRWAPIARGLALTLGDADLAAEATDEAMARAYPRWATLQ